MRDRRAFDLAEVEAIARAIDAILTALDEQQVQRFTIYREMTPAERTERLREAISLLVLYCPRVD